MTESQHNSGSQKKGIRGIKGFEGIFLFLALGLCWQFTTTMLPIQHSALYPTPAVTFKALLDSMPELLKGTWSSFLILIPGYLLAVLFGSVWGIIAGSIKWIHRVFDPFAKVAAPIPPTVYVPYAIALMPTFRISAIMVVFIGAFWPVFVNAAAGAASVPLRYRDNAGILGFGRFEYMRRVVFPAALPNIFSGMAVGLALAFILLTVAELFGANQGLGRFVQYYADYADYPRMVAGILYTGMVTFATMALLDFVKRRLLFWVR
ncbi:MAG: ABC transporter permease [Chlorobiales bacterium]|nr:ABC transporter permease [Chlorobiales bacterium]